MLSRRSFLAAAGVSVLAACSSGDDDGRGSADDDGGVTPRDVQKIAYGSDPSQFGELSVPDGRSRGTVVVIHGGFWQAQYGLDLGRPLAADLARHGWTAWNLEYRRVGDGGGWPTTLADVSDGIDKLDDLDVDTAAVVAVGHSAGGQLAVWAAGRRRLPAQAPGGSPTVALVGVVSQAGVLDLAVAADTGVGDGAPQSLVGGTPKQHPDRYAIADPIARVPLDAPVYCLHSEQDANVPYAQSTAYVAAARRAGGRAALHRTEGDHFTLIDPSSTAWTAARDALPALVRGELPG